MSVTYKSYFSDIVLASVGGIVTTSRNPITRIIEKFAGIALQRNWIFNFNWRLKRLGYRLE